MKKLISFSLFLFLSMPLLAQETPLDSLLPEHLKEVILIGRKKNLYEKQTKPLTSLEGYLQESGNIDMITRGGYAWEPILNSMSTERTVITIDGMRIFSACTDKMDPVTSYVEISNLSEADISSGQQGGKHGATIGGSIDLKRETSGLVDRGWQASVNSGFESNNSQKILGGAVSFADTTFYFDTNIMYRDANNYAAGGNKEVSYSQYTKFNVSATTGLALDSNKILEASVIYDKATDVGYAALPMDVSLAEALITSVEYQVQPLSKVFTHWETKLYYNNITHVMDDSKRPDVPIRMDMPGWSTTYGLYSNLDGIYNNHRFNLGLTSYYNRSLAEMTMYPANPQEQPMFMFTWPDLATWYTGISLQDRLELNPHSAVHFSGSLGTHHNNVSSEEGLESLRIFHPEMEKSKTRLLGGLAINYQYHHKKMQYNAGVGYGSRAPSVSEGYGFYLFNSFDAYDYIGNPDLESEKSAEVNASVSYVTKGLRLDLKGSYFHIRDYIIGTPDSSLSPMTIGANGVKVYQSLDYAELLNLDLHAMYELLPSLRWHGQLTYHHAADSMGEPLPLISPFSYTSSLDFQEGRFNAHLKVRGNATQTRYSPSYGEDRTPAFAVLDINGSYNFFIERSTISMTVGVENILDTHYSTYSDWNNIPRMGRNVFVHLSYKY